MVRWIAGLGALLFLFTASVFAQPFIVTWYYTSDFGQPLTTVCPAQGGTTPIPDGRTVKIFWDTNSNGPDATDPQPTVCIDPPLCEQGPPGAVNYDHFLMNGQAQGYGVGYFYTDPSFVSSGILPSPPLYYLRIYDTDGTTVLWTSRVFTIISGVQDIFLQYSDWTCGSGGPQCVVRDEHE
jgi:hypothetical protein